MKMFYYFQAVFDIGIAMILVGVTLLLGGDNWAITFIGYGLYLTITHGKYVNDFMNIIEETKKTNKRKTK